MCVKDYYQILEVDYDATEENIKLSYKRLALVSYLCPCYVHFLCYFISYFSMCTLYQLQAAIWYIHICTDINTVGTCRSGILTNTKVILLSLQNFKQSTRLTQVFFCKTQRRISKVIFR